MNADRDTVEMFEDRSDVFCGKDFGNNVNNVDSGAVQGFLR